MAITKTIVKALPVPNAPKPHTATAGNHRTCVDAAARTVSNAGSPPVVALTALMLVTAVRAPRAWPWAAAYALLAIAMPLGALTWMVRRGLVGDLDVQRREERAAPMLLTLALSGIGVLALLLGRAQPILLYVAATFWLEMALLLAVTWRWKISVHCSVAASGAVLASVLLGSAWPLLLLPCMAWSRVRLRRHTVAQTIAGTALGTALFAGFSCVLALV